MREAGFRSVTDPQLRKIKSLWLGMYDEGVVRSKSDQAIAAYVRRITKKAVNQCTVKDLQLVIETLKQWIDRVEDAAARERLLQLFVSLPVSSPVLQ